MKYQIIFLLGALILMQLSGCASVAYQVPDQVSIENPTLAELDNWKLTGKLGIRTPQKAQSINLVWQQQQHNYNLKLNGPIGFGTAAIKGNQQQAFIQQGSQVISGTPDQLGNKLLGVPLSVDAMSWWVKGLISPHHPQVSDIIIQDDGLISSFQQNGWQLTFSGYHAQGAYMIPKKISGRREDLSFKLVVTQWNFSN